MSTKGYGKIVSVSQKPQADPDDSREEKSDSFELEEFIGRSRVRRAHHTKNSMRKKSDSKNDSNSRTKSSAAIFLSRRAAALNFPTELLLLLLLLLLLVIISQVGIQFPR